MDSESIRMDYYDSMKTAHDAEKEKRRVEKDAAKQARQEEKRQRDEAKSREQERNDRISLLTERLRRSLVYCSCGKPIHSQACKLRDGYNRVRNWGCDVGVPKEDLDWYLKQPGFP